MSFVISANAGRRLDEILSAARARWGEARAQAYIRALFAYFERVAARETLWRQIPTDFGVEGFYGQCENHSVYWRGLSDGRIGIVAILPRRRHPIGRFGDDAEI